MSKFFETKMAEAKGLITAFTSAKSKEEALAIRYKLNKVYVEIAAGCEFSTNKKGETKIKFNKPIPSMAQMYELICLPACTFTRDEAEDDLEIGANVPDVEKCSNKKLKELFTANFLYQELTGADIMKIAKLGEEARKKANLTKTIIIAGCAVAVIGGATAAVFIIKNKKDKDAEACIDTPADDTGFETDDEQIEVELEELSSMGTSLIF